MSEHRNRVMEAFETARRAHESIHQRRKWTDEPYYLHPWRVAVMVGNETDNEDVVIAAVLHDVVEDVPGWTVAEVESRHGKDVAMLVKLLTHVYTTEAFPGLNRTARKAMEAKRIRETFSAAAGLIKTADNLDNLPSAIKHDPEFARLYTSELQAYFDSLPASGLKERLGHVLEWCDPWWEKEEES